MQLYRWSQRIRLAMLGSTAIAAVLAMGPTPGLAEPAPKPALSKSKPAIAKTTRVAATPDARWALPDALPADVMAHLTQAQWNGPQGLVAGVFDKVREKPASRDAVLRYASGLAPLLARDLATAVDLAVITANDRLALAPNAASVLNSQRADSGGSRAINFAQLNAASSIGTRAVPPVPPSAFDQSWNRTMIGAQIANGRGYTGAGVSVAVADSSFDITNDALVNRLDLTRSRNYINNTAATPYDPTYVGLQSNTDSHGSHVAGIIAAEPLGGIDMRGVAYDSRIVAIRLVLAGAEAPNAVYAQEATNPFVQSLDYFTSLNNVMVYNASYGPAPARTPPLSVWTVGDDRDEAAAAGRALAAGKIIVAANGNERADHPVAGLNPSGLALMPYLQANHANTGVYTDGGQNYDFSFLQKQPGLIIAVMAVASDKSAASYSNFCGVTASWCVAAPGGDGAVGPEVYSTIPVNTYGFLAGTSMAAPTVSGAIAVLIGAYPGYNARDLARLLFSTSEDLGAPGVDATFGYGLIRLDRATDPVAAPGAGGTVTVTANNTVYWGPPVTTAGGFTKAGDGVLTISGITTTPGTLSVAAGTLAVDGTLNVTGGGNVLSVGAGSSLAGFGVINGNTTITGSLSPGKVPNIADQGGARNFTANSPGILTFNGSVTLTSAAQTTIAVDGNLDVPGGPGTYSRIVVSGAGNVFTANGQLVPVVRGIAGGLNTYTPGLGAQFKIVDAQNGAIASGRFSSLLQPTTGLAANTRFDVDYNANWINLIVTPVSLTTSVPNTDADPNQGAVTRALEAARPAAGAVTTGPEERFFDALYALNSDDQYETAFRQLGGPGQVASPATAMLGLTSFNTMISSRQTSLQTTAADIQSDLAPSAALSYDRRTTSVEARQAASAFANVDRNASVSANHWSMWGRAFGSWTTVDSQDGILGAKTRTGGMSIGADRQLAPNLVGGMAAGFVRSHSSNQDASATFDSFTGALYASWTPGRFVVDMRAAVGSTSITTSRSLILTPTAITASTSGLAFGTDIEVGYKIPLGAMTVKPYAGFSTQVFHRRGYTESNAPFGLSFPDEDFSKVTTTLGAATSTLVRYRGWHFMPEFKAAWARDMMDTTLTTQASLLDIPLTLSYVDPGRDAALVGLTLTAWTKESFRLFTSYNGEFRERARTHQVSLGVRGNF